MNMFCFQCEQTAGGRGCEKQGVCGKDATTAALQDLLLYAAKGISQYATRSRPLGTKSNEIDVFVTEALFKRIVCFRRSHGMQYLDSDSLLPGEIPSKNLV